MTDINQKLVIDTAWRTGQFFNPAFPELLNVDAAAVEKLTAQDRVSQVAIAGLQQSDINLFPLIQQEHKRKPIFDGGIGPATMRLVNGWRDRSSPLRRCPLPDFAPPQGAAFDLGDADLNRAVAKMQAATGRGSWPHGCHGEANVHTVKISYDFGGAPAKVKEWAAELKKRSAAAVAAVGIKLIEVKPGEPAQIRVSWRVLAGSTIGLAEFNSESCGDSVFCYLDPGYAPDLEMVLLLLLHENGHNWNLNHRPGYIMNPSIVRSKAAWVERDATGRITYQDPSFPTLAGYFGGQPLETMPPPPPPPPGKLIVFDKLRFTLDGAPRTASIVLDGEPDPGGGYRT